MEVLAGDLTPSNPGRRQFLKSAAAATISCLIPHPPRMIQTVKGPVAASQLGTTLIHEHVLVDFAGADKINPDRWNIDEVVRKVLPYLTELRHRGYNTLFECTPAYLGRDVRLLQKLSEQSGIQLVTNTGYYGASDNKYLPRHAFTESSGQLAARWIREFEYGIDNTTIKPGFIKTGVNPGRLSEIHRKLITAAAMTHLKTGLTICSHTGPALPAGEQIEILEKNGVAASAFVWVHASGTDDDFLKTGKRGCWISLDGISEQTIREDVRRIAFLKEKNMLGQVLLSHDAGWYKPGEPEGGTFRGYTFIADKLVPLLRAEKFSDSDITRLLVKNPAEAFSIRIRKV
ncbi:phosphotriesterase family protein [Dyadobacter sandarakinus]|uniref:Phosphotriesterase n=1 Tax=Dyadobacter sandarakinus TaxID=2747268 RepID=A0ABX7I564_9BACT|nr:phosphotriesterase [Dyadobacter sandarakinus]QRR01239.1 phosphotriesterase [Dyadobacter sandarakinus]